MATVTSGISVLMPVYNGEPFVRLAVESILRQTHRDLELVVVDDGSTDGTASTLSHYSRRDPRVRVLRRPHCGIVSALNVGLGDCRHQLVARMDADDVAHPRRLEAQARYLDEHADCVAVGSQVRHIGAAGEILEMNVVPTQHAEIVDATIRYGCGMWHPSVIYRRDAVLKIGGYRAKCEWAEDLDLWLRLSEVGRLANLKQPLLNYRIHDRKVCRLRVREQRVLGRRIVREFCETRGLPIPARCRPSRSQLWREHAWDAIAEQRPAVAAVCGLRAICCGPSQRRSYHVTLLALRNVYRQIRRQAQAHSTLAEHSQRQASALADSGGNVGVARGRGAMRPCRLK